MSGRSNHIYAGLSFITVCIGIALVIFGAIKSSETAETNPSVASNGSELPANETDAEMDEAVASRPEIMPEAETDSGTPLINGCYHLDSCAFSKITMRKVIDSQGDEQLIEADLLHSATTETPDAPRSSLRWERRSKVYAICSTARPALVSRAGDGWTGQVFDMTMISGAENDDANVYQALCHNAYSNEIANEPEKYGYHALEEGNVNEFRTTSPQLLLSSN